MQNSRQPNRRSSGWPANRLGSTRKEVASHGSRALERDPTAQLACRVGDASCAGAHAETLNRATVQPAPDTLLRLQRQYGNRFVQRVVNLSRQGEGEAGVAPEVEQTIQSAAVVANRSTAAPAPKWSRPLAPTSAACVSMPTVRPTLSTAR